MGNDRIVRTLLAVAGVLALPACGGGGGGGGGATVSFAFTSGTLAAGEGGATDVTVVLTCLLPALDADATVDVADLGTGTAVSGSDYAAFAPQTVTFPAGSLDGATQVVTLTPLDDDLVEEPTETVRLALANPTGGVLYGVTQLTANVQDADTAAVAFATATSTTPEAAAPIAVALELELDAGVTLAVPVSVRVSDLRTGTAVPPVDYAFAAQTVTFPAGAADGAVQTVNVQLGSDAMTEGDETIELGLSQPSAACTLGALQTHELTIEDDDLAGNAAFLGSEGATGTENALAYDELLNLGAQVVDAGPNTGTLVRVSNGGGQPMDLDAPTLAGSHPNDFAVDIESTSLVAGQGGPAGGPLAAPAEGFAPLAVRADDTGPGVALRLDSAEIARLRGRREVTLHGIELPGLGPVALELRRRPLPVADDARLVIDGADVAGGPRTLLGDLQLWSGTVAGLAGSRVFLAFDGRGVQGHVVLAGMADRFVHVFADGEGGARLLTEPALLALGVEIPDEICAGELFAPGAPAPLGLTADDPAPPSSALTIANCRLALETDYQLYQRFNSSVLLTNYVTSLIAAVSEQYTEDVQATLSIAYLGVHTDANDGWSTQEQAGGDTAMLLNEFRTAWVNNGWPAQADLAHFLSGDSLGGGIAYVNVLCNQSVGFGVSGNMTGAINWATWTGQAGSFTWDFVVVAHELGHNFGSAHTHDYCPPLDECPPAQYWGSCQTQQVCTRGTLMSYCHVGCGGLSNVDLWFHPVNANIMRSRINASCLGESALLPGDFVQYRVRFNPLTATGARSATLSFAHDAPNATTPFRVQLSGTAN